MNKSAKEREEKGFLTEDGQPSQAEGMRETESQSMTVIRSILILPSNVMETKTSV